MTTQLAVILAALVVLALIVDGVFNGAAATVFMIRQLLDLIEYLAFWR